MNWRDIQRELAKRGFNPGRIDGIPGRNTRKAVEAFQRKMGLEVDGIVGSRTLGALFGPTSAKGRQVADLPWLAILNDKMGWHEVNHHKKLSDFLRLDGKTLGDPSKLPWCGDLVETCIALALPDEVIPGNPYLARSWAGFGRSTLPRYGAVGAFWRGSRDGTQGHVGFLIGQRRSDGAYRVRGGNQSNSISDTWLAAGRLLEARMPATFPALTRVLPLLDEAGALSLNEA